VTNVQGLRASALNPSLMTKTKRFRDYNPDQIVMLPPSLKTGLSPNGLLRQ
jgi:hypothetical protein